MRVIVDDEWVHIEGFERGITEGGRMMGLHTCRTAAQEAVAWAIKRLGEELEKSCAFARTAEPADKIALE